ncbi:MAG TPA: MaoC family dehydratase [Solirubrobacterales bacterium]|nr:MaoC family dehydratase [Solirubrobacterales bacterium]
MTAPEATRVLRIDDLAAQAGESLGTGPWRTVSQADIDGFADITGDHQWIHVDPVRAATGPFGGTVAHGFLTLSLCAVILDEVLSVEDAAMTVNYGLERVRFPSPVHAGSEVRGAVELVSAEPLEGGVQAILRVTIETRGATKPACVADCVIRFYRASKEEEGS